MFQISSEHYHAILETVSRIHSRYHILPIFVHCVAVFIVLSIVRRKSIALFEKWLTLRVVRSYFDNCSVYSTCVDYWISYYCFNSYNIWFGSYNIG